MHMVVDLPIRNASYSEASDYVVENTNLDNIQIFAYNNFVKNVIRRYMSRTYKSTNTKNAFEFRFVKWWLDTSKTLPPEVCKAQRKSLEVSLYALIEITFTNNFVIKNVAMPNNSITVTAEVTRFPYLTDKGNFIINGIDRVMISHLEKANKLFLRAPSEKDIKQKGQLELQTSSGARMTMSNNILFTNVAVRGDSRSATFSYEQIMQQLGLFDTESMVSIVGVNNFFMSRFSKGNLSMTENNYTTSIHDIMAHFKITLDERQSINDKVCFTRNITSKELAEDVTLTFRDGSTKIIPKGTILTSDMAEEIQETGITSVYIIEKGLSVPVLNNGYVNAKKLFNDYGLEIPTEFIVETCCPLNDADGVVKHLQYYLPCNKVEFDALLAAYGDDMEILRSQINLNIDRLLGRCLSKNDLLAMINYFSRGIAKLVPFDDVDSLENKRVINIADIFEKGLAEAIGTTCRYVNRSEIPKSSILSKIDNLKKLTINASNEQTDGFQLLMGMDFNLDCGDYTITRAVMNNKLFNPEDSTNPLSQMDLKRRLTLQEVPGFGGVSSQTPDPAVRSNNPSYSGRIDCIGTPESQSVGLVRETAALAFLDEFGQLEAPYFRVDKKNKVIDTSKVYYMTYDREMAFHRALSPRLADKTGVKVIYYKDGSIIHDDFYPIPVEDGKSIDVSPFKRIAQQTKVKLKASTFKFEIHKRNWFIDEHVSYLEGHGKVVTGSPEDVDFVSCSGDHIFSPITSAIPFIDFDDAARGMMGSGMSKQAIAIYGKQLQYVSTPYAKQIARTATGVILAPYDLIVDSVDALFINVTSLDTNQSETISCLRQDRTTKTTLNKSIPIVKPGDFVLKGDVLADSTSSINGELAHGTQLLMSIQPLYGDNYEDGVLISERLVKDDIYTSIHIETFEMKISSPTESITNRLDVVAGRSLDNLTVYNYADSSIRKIADNKYNNNGIITPGSVVQPKEVLACKLIKVENKHNNIVTYKVHAVKYSGSVPGTVVAVDQYKEGTDTIYSIKVANKLKIGVGDKYTGRHGNKGIICRVVPIEDMPFLESGRRMDIVVNPLGIPSRMNIGQVLDGHLGFICHESQMRAIVKVLNNVDSSLFKKVVKLAGCDKMQLYDGRTGKPFRYKTTVVMPYTEKLEHVVSHKIHARLDRPYTTKCQPTQGKSQNGGQRVGEMEFNMFEAHGASNVVRELVTFKSDDVENRIKYQNYKNEKARSIDVHSLKQNTPYAFQLSHVYYCAMFYKPRYYGKDGEEIDIFGEANSTKPGIGRNYHENLKAAKAEYEHSDISTDMNQINLLDISEDEDDDDEEYIAPVVIPKIAFQSPTESKFKFKSLELTDDDFFNMADDDDIDDVEYEDDEESAFADVDPDDVDGEDSASETSDQDEEEFVDSEMDPF